MIGSVQELRHSGRSRGGDEPAQTDRGIEATEYFDAFDGLAAREAPVDLAHERGVGEAQRGGVESIGSDIRELDATALGRSAERDDRGEVRLDGICPRAANVDT